jgi:hypothetical protein
MNTMKGGQHGEDPHLDVPAMRPSVGAEEIEGLRLPEVSQPPMGRTDAYATLYTEIGRVVWDRARRRAASAVNMAVQAGALAPLSGGEAQCVDCGRVATIYEHRDYRKLLQVVPVCRGCNQKRGPADFDVRMWLDELEERELLVQETADRLKTVAEEVRQKYGL